MRTQAFRGWLARGYTLQAGGRMSDNARANHLSTCKRIEQFEGDLDEHFRQDGLGTLLARLRYTAKDAAALVPPSHRVPLTGDLYRYTAHLRSALNRYRDFSMSGWPENGDADLVVMPVPGLQRTHRGDWPVWELPTEADLLLLAQRLTQHVRFLEPEIVQRVVEDNERHGAHWAEQLHARGIFPALYLWDRCATAFPGVRRFAGSTESAQLRKRLPPNAAGFTHALKLDDNSYPKQLWSFALRGIKANRRGPERYALAHLADHKEYGSRLAREFSGVTSFGGEVGLPGLFTSAANTAFVPEAYLRPTDTAGPVRNLLHRRALQLYGGFCNLLPPGWDVVDAVSDHWSVDAFDWAPPVGSVTHAESFLNYREATLQTLLAGAPGT